MINSFILFACCLALGVLCRLVFVGLIRLDGKISRVLLFFTEFLCAALAGFAFLVIMFFLADGVFMPFTLITVCIGFTATSLAI